MDLLPDKDVLEITTMCGHAMVTPCCVEKIVKKVMKGKIDSGQAAKDLARSCTCGIFNIERTTELMEKLCMARSTEGGG